MKANLVLAVLLLILATIYFATETEFKITEEATEAFNPLLPGFDESMVSRIQISYGDQNINILKNTGLYRASGLPGKWLIKNAQYHPGGTCWTNTFWMPGNGRVDRKWCIR